MALVLRGTKGSELTHEELDGNFTYLDAKSAAPVQSVNGQTGVVDLSGSYAPLSHVGSGGAAHANVVAGGAAGFMTGADKSKLDGIAPGAQANVGTDISIGYNPAYVFVNSSTGSDATLDAATALAAGVMSASDKTKLDGVAAGAMANPMTTAGDIIVGASGGTPARLGMGSALQVLRVNAAGTNLEYAAPSGGGGGLTNFAESLSTSTPNAVTYAVKLIPLNTGATDIDFVLEPKGGGALLRKIPDNATSGGAKRGARATDLQASRSAAAQVASGSDSFVAGSDNTASSAWAVAIGYSNTASGNYAVALGYGNLAQQSGAVALGQLNSATGAQAFAVGNNNTASGGVSAAIGNGNTASGTNSVAIGATCTASGNYSFASGRHSSTRGVIGARAHASGQQAALGDSQTLLLVSRVSTSDATSSRLTANGAAASAANQVLIPTNSAIRFRGEVVARNISNGDCATWSISGLIKNVGGTVSLVGTPAATLDFNDAGAAAWALAVSADNTNKSLALSVTGAASTSIHWVSTIRTVEVTA